MAVTAQADEVHRVLSTAVDPAFYRTIYPDLVAAGADPLTHYRTSGWLEGRDPAPWFCVKSYLAANDDVRESGLEPLSHFLIRGRFEGRETTPSAHGFAYLRRAGWKPPPWRWEDPDATPWTAPEPPTQRVIDVDGDRAAIQAEFDIPYYLATNPDVVTAGVDPVWHFIVVGWTEGRNPSAWFSLRDYLEMNPDVAQAGMNPFVHYLRTGRGEGRTPRHELGFRYDLIARLPPPQSRLAGAIEASERISPTPASQLAEGLATAPAGLKDLHVTFSHDDYLGTFGGMQLSLRRESQRFAELGIDHLHLYPAAHWSLVREAGEPGPLGVRLNGRPLGVFPARVIRERLARAAADVPAGRRSFAIHSLLGHSARETASILQALDLKAGYFWLHDFASLCAGYHLLRNEVEDCSAPPPDSAACAVCSNRPFRDRHLKAHGDLFRRLELTVVAPSETTLKFWRASWNHPAADAVVLPHATLIERAPAAGVAGRRRLRVAFVGMPAALKGWPVFRELAERFADDRRYQFLHLGGRPDPAAPAAFHEVVVCEDRPTAMQEAIAALEVDVALIWPLCRETFSFTAYEAVAGGAAVLTGPDSGNVAAFVTETGQGCVLANEAALFEAFASGEIRSLGRARRGAKLYDLAFSGLTADLVAAHP